MGFTGSVSTGIEVEQKYCDEGCNEESGKIRLNLLSLTLSPSADIPYSFGAAMKRDFPHNGMPRKWPRRGKNDNFIADLWVKRTFGNGNGLRFITAANLSRKTSTSG